MEENIPDSIVGEYVTIDGEDWYLGSNAEFKVQDQKTDLEKGTDRITLGVVITDAVEKASGTIIVNYEFSDRAWKKVSAADQGDFKVEEIPEKVIHVDENTILDYIEGAVIPFGRNEMTYVDPEDTTVSYGFLGGQDVAVSKDDVTEFAVDKQEAKEKGIRITYIDSYTKEELQDLTVATDNVNAGRMLGEYARKLIDKDSKIAIVSHVKGVSTAVEREQGFREGLGDYADNIVDIVYCNSLYEKSYELAQELMRKYPDLELIAGMNEYSAVGVGRAVSDAGAKDKIAVVGVDCSQEAINLMEMGVYKGIIVQKAFRMGYIGVEETIHMLNGDAVEKNIDSGCELVTPENMYNSDIERLIFPFS